MRPPFTGRLDAESARIHKQSIPAQRVVQSAAQCAGNALRQCRPGQWPSRNSAEALVSQIERQFAAAEAFMPKSELKIVQLPIDVIRERPGNVRVHSAKQITKLAQAIATYGFVVPCLVDQDHVLIAGHARWAAAKRQGLSRIPVIKLEHLSPEQVRALVLADNRMSELGSYDKKLLAKELAELVELLPMPELLATGYELDQIELLQDAANSQVKVKEEPEPCAVDRSVPAITELGDCWLIGDHRLICSDALKAETYDRLLGRERADLVITDPPYNRKVNGEISGLGSTKHAEFVAGSGELSRPEFQQFLSDMCRNLAAFSRSGSLHYIFMDWRSIGDLLQAGEGHYDGLQNVIVWMKTNGGGMGSFYRSQHELVTLFKKGKRAHKNNVALGVNGRNRTNVWQFPGANSSSRRADLKLHPTVKNADMIAEAIRDASDRGDLVMDGFAGSGTLLIAAEQTGRRARMVELDPYYCDLILTRAAHVGLFVSLESTGQSPSEVAAERQERRSVLPEVHRDEPS
ncbi:DNA methyltransferase [Sphingomonas sp. BN140010]|uniref:site-specific DNA-methyltransferase (adenine-specific) n=1 Tax=Sphingomonas arvum TaxID=2992113 RepID=A0ABT3JDP0_9SPHN|nr:DNA methyltransferase [Sphingomonas sp. BN140010]MCW3797188.1 DNA methyltransferase [Sphingomonas sp. BN140010]